MADNVTFQTTAAATPPNATVVATDDVSGVQYQRVKLDGGGDGAAVPFVAGQQARTASLPVALSTEDATLLAFLLSEDTFTPTMAALQATADASAASLTSIDGKLPALVSSRVPVDGSGVTQPVSAASLPLPTGAATSAAQTTGNASLASIDAGIPAGLGQTTASASMPVVLASDYNAPILPTNVTPTWSNIAANNTDGIAAAAVANYRAATVQLSGTWSATVSFQISNDGTNWVTIPYNWLVINGTAYATGMTSNGIYEFNVPPAAQYRIRTTAYSSGTVVGNVVLSSLTSYRPVPTATPQSSSGVSMTTALSADAFNSASTAIQSLAAAYGYNGSTWDRQRNVNAVSVLASSARTTTQTGSDQTNYNFRGLILYVNVTSAGTGSITPSLDIKDSVSAAYKTIWTAAAAITTTGLFTYVIGPDAAAAAGYTEAVLRYIGRTFRVNVTANNANSVTYSVSMDLLPM